MSDPIHSVDAVIAERRIRDIADNVGAFELREIDRLHMWRKASPAGAEIDHD